MAPGREPARTLREAYTNLDPNASLPGEAHPFYVPRPEEFGPGTLQQALELASPSDKILFTGHRGIGKSTELRRLAQKLREQFLVVYFTVEDQVDLADINYHDILLVLGGQLCRAAQDEGIDLDSELLEDLTKWYQGVVFEREEVSGKEVSVGVGLQAIINVGLQLRKGSNFRKKVREQVEPRLTELVALINRVIENVREKSGRSPLVLLDGSDKVYDISAAVKMFREGAGVLIAPDCPIVYTVPLVLLYAPELGSMMMNFRGQYLLPNVRLFNRDGSKCDEGWKMFNEILRRRVSEELLPPEARESLIKLSGGVLKHLISYAGQAVLEARYRGGEREPVMVEDVNSVAHRERLVLSPTFNPKEREELSRVAREHTFINSSEAVTLAVNLHILQYTEPKGEWWDVHPILKPLLEAWKQ